MPSHKTTSLALVAALSGSLVLGGVAVAAPQPQPAPQAEQAPRPLPAEEDIVQQTEVLAQTNEALRPVAKLLKDALATRNAKMAEVAAARHAQAVDAGLTEMRADAPAERGDRAARPQIVTKAVSDLDQKANALLTAARTDDRTEKVNAARAALTAAVNVMTSVALGGDLPSPNLAGMPDMPARGDAAQPVSPEAVDAEEPMSPEAVGMPEPSARKGQQAQKDLKRKAQRPAAEKAQKNQKVKQVKQAQKVQKDVKAPQAQQAPQAPRADLKAQKKTQQAAQKRMQQRIQKAQREQARKQQAAQQRQVGEQQVGQERQQRGAEQYRTSPEAVDGPAMSPEAVWPGEQQARMVSPAERN